MTNDTIEMALASVLEELEASRKKDEEDKAMLQAIENKINKLEEGFNTVKMQMAKQVNTTPLETSIAKGISRLQQTIEAQPKTVRREFRVLLFPEYDAKEYYRLVFGKLIFWMVVILIATYLFMLGKQVIEKWSMISMQNREINEYRSIRQHPSETIGGNDKKRTNSSLKRH